jgi:hypothetical protein
MFGRGKKKTPAKKPGKRGKAQPQRGPLRYLSLIQTVRYGQNLLDDVRGLESVAFPVIGLIVWRTYQSERRRQLKAQAARDQERIRTELVADITGHKKRKRFILF